MVNNPNSVLQSAIADQHITETITLHVTSTDTPVPGGGTANTAFLKGGNDGPNAVSASVDRHVLAGDASGANRLPPSCSTRRPCC